MKPTSTPTVPATVVGPGQQLRQARTDLRLAPEDVAQILRLAPKQIVALESDDYANLPGPTYVRGYLRSYAQFLGLSPERVIESYNCIPAATARVDLTKLSPPPQINSEHHVIKFASYGVVIVVFGLAVAWWLGRDDASTRPKPVALGKVEQAIPASDQPPPTSADPKEAVSTTPVDPVRPVGVPVTEIKPAPVIATTKPVTPGPESAKTPVSVTNPIPLVSSPAVAAVTGPRARLVLGLNQDSWVDIRDARQNKLLYETVGAGRSVTVEGVAPLSVFLGNVDGVTLEFNGKPYDPSPHKRGPVARFTLGDGAENSGHVLR
jgi:cytoskeleton protein RodZ